MYNVVKTNTNKGTSLILNNNNMFAKRDWRRLTAVFVVSDTSNFLIENHIMSIIYQKSLHKYHRAP